MKKLTTFLLIILCSTLISCNISEKTSADKGSHKIEKSIDAVANELGLKKRSNKLFRDICAKDGAGYNKHVELYLYDENSETYLALINEGYNLEGHLIKADAYNSGIVLLFSDYNVDLDIMHKFKEIKFK